MDKSVSIFWSKVLPQWHMFLPDMWVFHVFHPWLLNRILNTGWLSFLHAYVGKLEICSSTLIGLQNLLVAGWSQKTPSLFLVTGIFYEIIKYINTHLKFTELSILLLLVNSHSPPDWHKYLYSAEFRPQTLPMFLDIHLMFSKMENIMIVLHWKHRLRTKDAAGYSLCTLSLKSWHFVTLIPN